MLFLSLFKNLWDNRPQLESLCLVQETVKPELTSQTDVNITEELAEIDRRKSMFDFGGGFASVDLNSDAIGIDENFLNIDAGEEAKQKKDETPEQREKRLRNPLDIKREEDEDAELLEALVRVRSFLCHTNLHFPHHPFFSVSSITSSEDKTKARFTLLTAL